jgi:hypothetical protein
LIAKFPEKLRETLAAGGDTTLMVWADIDDNFLDGDALRSAFWEEAQSKGIVSEQFNKAVFVFAKDRIENWIEFLNTGSTDESIEGPRTRHNREAADAASRLAGICLQGAPIPNVPLSLEWSCRNWRELVSRFH